LKPWDLVSDLSDNESHFPIKVILEGGAVSRERDLDRRGAHDLVIAYISRESRPKKISMIVKSLGREPKEFGSVMPPQARSSRFSSTSKGQGSLGRGRV